MLCVRTGKGDGSSGTAVTGGCEPSNEDAGNQTQLPRKSGRSS